MDLEDEGPGDSGDGLLLREADVGSPTADLVKRTIFRGGVLSAFGHRDFAILWQGAFLSNVGTLIHTTVLLWYVKQLTGSDAWVGAANLANFLPIIVFVLFAGSLADHLDRKRLILWTQVVMMVTAFALGLCFTTGVATLPVILLLTVVMGTAFAFSFPAWRSLTPDLVPSGDLLNAVALDAAGYNMARAIGPALGALVLSLLGVATAFYINTVSFLAVIAAILLVRTSTPAAAERAPTLAHIKEGILYVRKNRWAVNLLAVLGIAAFFGLSCLVLLPALSRDVLHKGSMGYGLLLGAIGLGAVIGAPLVTLLNARFMERDIIRFGMLATSLCVIGAALSRNLALSMVFTTGIGVSFLAVSASINTVLQSRVEREMRGRIMSFYILLFQGVSPFGGLALGYLSDFTSAPIALTVGGAACLVLSLVLIVFPAILHDAVSPGRG